MSKHLTIEAAATTSLNFSGLTALVVGAVGALIIVIMTPRIFLAYIQRAWGAIIAEIAFVMVVGWFCWFPTSAIATLKAITQGVTGA